MLVLPDERSLLLGYELELEPPVPVVSLVDEPLEPLPPYAPELVPLVESVDVVPAPSPVLTEPVFPLVPVCAVELLPVPVPVPAPVD